MSVGGIFQIITNDGIQDKLIMNTDLLMNRLKEIKCKKIQDLQKQYPNKTLEELEDMEEDWQPTMNEIQRTHILYCNSTFKPFVSMAHEYSKTVPRGGIPSLGSTFSFMLPIVGDFVNDAVLYVKLTGLSAKSALDKVRYCEFLGHRLMQNVNFKVSNQLVDSYTSSDYNAYYQFKVPIQKTNGYLTNIGQEIPKVGYLTADPTVDEVREYRFFGDGPQTFKQIQPDIEMWIPILFWFKDIQNSLPNFLLPIGQTEIEISFDAQQNLVAFADYGGGGAYNVPIVSECYLYLNHIFLQPEVNEIFITRFGFQLIRVHRRHTEQLIESSKNVRLNQLKWPVESIYIGFRPVVNLTNSQTWYKNTHVTPVSVKEAVVSGASTILVNTAIFYDEQQVVRDLTLRASDIVIYPTIQPEFYNNYIPYRYGNTLKTPDMGWMMMNFNVEPGNQQPSGHFNISRARELYLIYNSAVDDSGNYIVRTANPVELIVLADCINFMLYKNNNLVLRFST